MTIQPNWEAIITVATLALLLGFFGALGWELVGLIFSR